MVKFYTVWGKRSKLRTLQNPGRLKGGQRRGGIGTSLILEEKQASCGENECIYLDQCLLASANGCNLIFV